MAGEAPYLCEGFPIKSYTPPLPFYTERSNWTDLL